MRRAPWAGFRSRLLQLKLELAWLSDALQDLTYVLYFLARNPGLSATRDHIYILVDRTWIAAHCRACSAVFGFPSETVIISTRDALEKAVEALTSSGTTLVIVSKILYLKYYSVLQDLRERGTLIVA